MNFGNNNVQSFTISEGEVIHVVKDRTVLWSKPGAPAPVFELPDSNQIWYEASSQISSNIGSPTDHTFNSTTGMGILTYSEEITTSTRITSNAFKGNSSLLKIWWPDCCTTWTGDCMHSCDSLTHIYAGSGLVNVSPDVCNGGVPLESIVLYDNSNFANNSTGLVKLSNQILVLGTKNLDIRDTQCTTLGSRFMADMNISGCTLYFPSTVTTWTGDYNLGNDSNVFTAYFYSTVAPTRSYLSNIRCASGTTIHIPVGSLESYQTKWAALNGYSNMTFVEDL